MENQMKQVLLLAMLVSGCTENLMARQYGGAEKITVRCGYKVVSVTWKESNLWVLLRPMHEGETAETLVFAEKSSMGALEGMVTVVECARRM
jgi:homoserine kinase